jgi:hypothetical protein
MVNNRCAPLIVYAFRRVRSRQVDRRVPHLQRRTRRNASIIGGGTPDMTIGGAAADQAERVPTCTVARGESVKACLSFGLFFADIKRGLPSYVEVVRAFYGPQRSWARAAFDCFKVWLPVHDLGAV